MVAISRRESSCPASLQPPAEYFGAPPPGQVRCVLDAGCGNGMLAYKNLLLGNRVIGITFKENEVAGCRLLFNDHLSITEQIADQHSWRIA